MKLPLKPHPSAPNAVLDADGKVLFLVEPAGREEVIANLNDYPLMLRVVLAAWDVIDDRAKDYLDNTISPYRELHEALVKLANRVPTKEI
jgi:hypothetical protein